MDEGVAFRAEGGDAEGHGDAVVAAGVDGGAMEGLASGNVETVFKLFHLGAHGAQVLDDEGDAVRLLDAELPGVADADSAASVRPNSCKDRQLVNQLSGECATHLNGSQALGWGSDLDRADQFCILFFKVEYGNMGAEGGEHVKQSGPCRVKSNGIKKEVGARKEGGGTEKEGGRGDVSRDRCVNSVERLAPGDGDRV